MNLAHFFLVYLIAQLREPKKIKNKFETVNLYRRRL